MVRCYLWHLKGKWESVMEKIENGPIKSLKAAHEKFLRNRVGRKKPFSGNRKGV